MNQIKIFQSIKQTCESIGLSQHYLRTGCKNGTIPHTRSGNKYYINVPLLLKQLELQKV